MKKFFAFAMIVAMIATVAQANTNLKDTIKTGNITYQPVVNGKILNVSKGDTAMFSGLDSVVVIKTDTATKSEYDAIYVGGVKKYTGWFKTDSKTQADPTNKGKFVFIAIGGDEDSPADPKAGLLSIFLIVVVGAGSMYSLIRLWR